MLTPADRRALTAYVVAARISRALTMAAVVAAFLLTMAQGPPGIVLGGLFVLLARLAKPPLPPDLLKRLDPPA